MSITLEKFHPIAEAALIQAQHEAQTRQQPKVEAEHLLYSLLFPAQSQSDWPLLEAQRATLRQELTALLESLPRSEETLSQVYISRKLRGILHHAEEQALRQEASYITPEHVLVALLQTGDEYVALCAQSGLTPEALKSGHQSASSAASEASSSDVLALYCVDFLALARQDKLDPVIGRDEEVRRLVQILSRRIKNNPILIGEPGVGKTAIVEGLAQRILAGDVPDSLRGKRLMGLDLGALVAGATHRGEFEDRLKRILREFEQATGDAILFIDEMHTLIGAGSTEGGLDAANLLKPALARGHLRCIGATTLTEFKQHIEKDAALVRRFQQILVNEPDTEATIAILRGLKDRYELHHRVRIKDSALIAASKLSQRYITERFLPDKAIDLIDEAAGALRIQMDSLPTEVDQLERKILQLEMQQRTLRKEEDSSSRQQLLQVQRELHEYQERSHTLKHSWQEEREQFKAIYALKEEIERVKAAEREAQRQGNLERAASLRYETLDGLESKLKQLQNQAQTRHSQLLKETIDEEDIARIVSLWTGIPVARMLQEERHKLLQIEQYLGQRLIGQNEALSSVANAIRRSRAGVHDPRRPIGSFIFLGSSGVGKTQLAYALAEFLFDNPQSLIRFDMSEYMEKASVTRLIGAPPGLVGFEEGGELTEAIRRRPYAVLLFDEIEKAHPDIFHLFLQILDHGQLTDSQGRSVDFRNTLIILTTNLGWEAIKQAEKTMEGPELVDVARQELLRQFRPEFLNRLDEIIVFRSLSLAHMRQICLIQIKQLQERLAAQQVQLRLSDTAQMYLAKKGYDPAFGARLLKRIIQREIEDVVAIKLLEGSLSAGHLLTVEADQGRLGFMIT